MSAKNSQTIMQSPARTQVIVVPQRSDYSKKPINWVFTALLLAGIGGTSLGIGLTRDCRFTFSGCGSSNTGRIIFGSFAVAASVCCLIAAAVLHNKRKMAMQLIQSSLAQQPVAALPGYCVTVTTMPAEHPPPYSPSAAPLPPAANQYPPPAGFEDAPRPTQAYPKEDTQPLFYCP